MPRTPLPLPRKLPAALKRDLYLGWRTYRQLDVVGHIEHGLTLDHARIAWAFVDWLQRQDPKPKTGLDYIDDTYAAFRKETKTAP
jgi:hypothetical protein